MVLKIEETAKSSETLVSYVNTARCQHPEDPDLNLHCRENSNLALGKVHDYIFHSFQRCNITLEEN